LKKDEEKKVYLRPASGEEEEKEIMRTRELEAGKEDKEIKDGPSSSDRTALVRLVTTLLTVLVQSCVICPSTAGFWDGASPRQFNQQRCATFSVPHDSLARNISYLRGGAGFVSNIMIRQGSNIMKETMAAKDIDAVRCTSPPRLPLSTLPQSISLSPAHLLVHFCRLPVESSQRGAADESDEESNVSLNTRYARQIAKHSYVTLCFNAARIKFTVSHQLLSQPYSHVHTHFLSPSISFSFSLTLSLLSDMHPLLQSVR